MIMRSIWNFISTISILLLTFVFLRWYIKGHFGKYFILFWLWTLLSIVLYIYNKNNQPLYDSTPGYVYWERNIKNQ